MLEDGTLIELVYRPEHRSTHLILFSAGRWTLQDQVEVSAQRRLVPFSPNNNLIKNEVVLLPSEPRIYGSEHQLTLEIAQFIHKYCDLTPTFEQVACYYVLLTWLYDAFNDLPYLRLRGDFGTGKTRALLTIGSLCYKPFFASGASTVSPIFHTLDAVRGTLIFDEADFRFSDERAEIVKILNNGNTRGLPVLRTMMNQQREFNPRAFASTHVAQRPEGKRTLDNILAIGSLDNNAEAHDAITPSLLSVYREHRRLHAKCEILRSEL